MAKSESTHTFCFLQKKPMLIVMEDSWDDRLEDRISFWPDGNEMAIHLSRENLKKLYVLIQERLKGERCSFSEGNELIHHLEPRGITSTPAEEALRGI